jgi:hypothetical protein
VNAPQNNKSNPGMPGQIKTMFITEGNPDALVVTESINGFSDERYWFPYPEAALAWCRANRCNFVYHPALPNN